MRYLILSLLTLLLFICACGDSADDNRITVEWIYSDTAKVIAAVHKIPVAGGQYSNPF